MLPQQRLYLTLPNRGFPVGGYYRNQYARNTLGRDRSGTTSTKTMDQARPHNQPSHAAPPHPSSKSPSTPAARNDAVKVSNNQTRPTPFLPIQSETLHRNIDQAFNHTTASSFRFITLPPPHSTPATCPRAISATPTRDRPRSDHSDTADRSTAARRRRNNPRRASRDGAAPAARKKRSTTGAEEGPPCRSLYLVMDCWWLCSFNRSFAHTRSGLLLTHRPPPLISPYVYSSLHSSIATQ